MDNFENTMQLQFDENQKQIINNKELRKYLQAILDIDNITREDLQKVGEIVLDGENIVGKYNKVYFDEVDLFPNLKNISIRHLGLTQEDLKHLTGIPQIEFTNCELPNLSTLKNATDLTLNDTEIYNIEKELEAMSQLIELKLINLELENFEFLKQLNNLKRLDIKNIRNFSLSQIDFYMPIEYLSVAGIDKLDLNIVFRFKNLKKLSIDRLEIDKFRDELKSIQDKGIQVSLNDMYTY